MEVLKAAILKICLIFAVVLVIGNASETILDDEEPVENCNDLLHSYLENLLDSKFSVAISDIEAHKPFSLNFSIVGISSASIFSSFL